MLRKGINKKQNLPPTATSLAMGNCQAVDAAAIIIQHPDGASEKAYCSLPAAQVMAANPGHYVAVIVAAPSHLPGQPASDDRRQRTPPTRYLKLLRPDDTLLFGRVYRLVSFEEVLREFASKRHVRLSRLLLKQEDKTSSSENVSGSTAPTASRQDDDCGGPATELQNSPAAVCCSSQEQERQVEAQLETALDEVVQGTMSSPSATPRAASARHGLWRPALQSIAEVDLGSSN